MSITYLMRCGLFPGSISDSPDHRTTDDKFLMEIDVDGDTSGVREMLEKIGATEINEKDISCYSCKKEFQINKK